MMMMPGGTFGRCVFNRRAQRYTSQFAAQMAILQHWKKHTKDKPTGALRHYFVKVVFWGEMLMVK